MTLIMDLNILLQEVPSEFTILQHPKRMCAYDELDDLIRRKRVNYCEAKDQYKRYKRDSFPVKYGLGEHGVLIRNFKSKQVREVCEMWWKEFMIGVQRDQVSLSYCFWKMEVVPYYIPRTIRKKYFKKNKHL